MNDSIQLFLTVTEIELRRSKSECPRDKEDGS